MHASTLRSMNWLIRIDTECSLLIRIHTECSLLIRIDTECSLRSRGARSQFIYARVAGEASLTSDETLIEKASSQDTRIAKALQSDALRSNCNHLLISSSPPRRPSAHHGANHLLISSSPPRPPSAHHGATVANTSPGAHTNVAGARRMRIPAAFVTVVRDDQASLPSQQASLPPHGPLSLKSPARVAVRCMKAHLVAPAAAPPGPSGAIVGGRAASRGSASERMQLLRQLLDAGFISLEEYDRKRKQIVIQAEPVTSGAEMGARESSESSEDMSAMRV